MDFEQQLTAFRATVGKAATNAFIPFDQPHTDMKTIATVTKEELATLLNGRECREEMTKEEEALAKASGLVVVFGASDDLMEFRGAIYDEVGAYNGTRVYLTADGILPDCDSKCIHAKRAKEKAYLIDALWDSMPYSWTYETQIPHATFDILDDGELDCRGIVFSIDDLSDLPF